MKLMVIDGNSLANRAFYGTPALNNSQGVPTGAIYSFFNALNRHEKDIKPDGICVTFDEKAPTFRHLAFEEYKGTRKKMPDELRSQMDLIKKILHIKKIPCYSMEGWEADDLLGTISQRCQGQDWDCAIVTGDRDALQLATDRTTIHLMTNSGTKTYSAQQFEEEYQFPPIHIVDLKAIMGDSSDNIPGIRGVGPKTAQPLIQEYHSIHRIYEALQDPDETLGLTPRLVNLFRQGEEICNLSHDLARIRCDAPLEFSPTDSLPQEFPEEELLTLLQSLELNKLIDLYQLSEMEEAQSQSFVATCQIEEIHDFSAFSSYLSQWTGEKLGVLCLPDLKGIAIHHNKEDSPLCLLILEHAFDDFGKMLTTLFTAEVKIITDRSKILYHQLISEGIAPTNIHFDVEVAAYLLSPDSKSYTLEELSSKYLHLSIKEAATFTAEESFSPLANIQSAKEAFASHCAVLPCLELILQERLEEQGLIPLYEEIELPLCRVLAEIEAEGILVDRKALSLYSDKLAKQLEEFEAAIYAEAGEVFNINSPKQLGVILFEKLELPPVKKTKTGYSTNAEVLETLRTNHPDCKIISLILDQRHVSKLHSTYAKGLMKELSPQNKIHSSFQNTVTATGRLSSTEPNLQNIPIRTPLGAELRNMFVAEEGSVLIDADYSQIELRLLAHIAEDEGMLEAFRSGEDIHAQTASQVFHTPLEEVTPSMRRSAKAVNFGIVYGMSAFALSQDINVTVAEAKHYINRYFETYPNVKAYLDKVIQEGRENGFVTTLLGRKRWLPELKSSNFQRRSFAERMAQNTPIQGAAADVIKKAMIAVSDRLKSEGLTGKLVLQVHDELLVQCPKSEAEATAKLIQEEMEKVLDLTVPLLAETHIGQNWGEAH